MDESTTELIVAQESQQAEISALEEACAEQEATIGLQEVIIRATSPQELMQLATDFFLGWLKCDAVGIRLRDGEDYPYYETKGFPESFVIAENSLCSTDSTGKVERDDAGNPVLACMCGNIICGRFDPSKSFFTERGSFWSNCTTELLATTTEADRQARTRNRCNGEGYESVGLFPLRVGAEAYGLLQINAKRIGLFTPGRIACLERLANYLAVALSHQRTEEKLRESEERFRSLAHAAPSAIVCLSPDHKITEFNFEAERLYGRRRDEVMGQDYVELFVPAEVREAVAADIQKVLEGTPTSGYESDVIAAAGDRRTLTWNVDRLLDTHGAPTGIIACGLDITERKRAEEAVQKFHTTLEMRVEQRTAELKGVNDQLREQIAERTRAEQALEKRTHDLGERVKELRGLQRVSALATDSNKSIAQVLQGVVDSIPPAWQYPDIAAARIVVEGQVYSTRNFQETPWRLTDSFVDSRDQEGTIEVCYSEEVAGSYGEIFLKEEENLIKEIAIRLQEFLARRQAEGQMRFQAQLLDSVHESVVASDLAGRITYWGRGAAALYGYAAEEVMGESIMLIVEPSDEEVERARMLDVLKHGLWNGEVLRRSRDRGPFWADVTISRLTDEGGRPFGFIGVDRDITERKQNQARLRQQQAELAHVSRLSTMGEMAAGFSHELNQPLSAILSYAEAGRLAARSAGGVPEKILNDLREIATLAARAGDIIHRIKTFVRKREPSLSSVDLRKTIRVVEQLLHSEMLLDNVAFRAEIDGDLRPIIGDEVQIQQVLLNLLRNAVDAVLETGDARHEVTIRASAGGDGAVALSVCDNGVGLSPEISDHLFEPFVTTKPAGLGMGLSISRSIIEAHGGHLTASRNREHGMTFRFTLPAYNEGANHET